MAKVEVNLGDEKPAKTNDFKSQISQASTKIARRKTLKSEEDLEKPLSCLRATKSTTVPSSTEKPEAQPTMVNVRGKVEELDPFVKEILSSDSVPKAVKTKIREECWSLFNDPRTPKGVKQCILNTMLSKTQSEWATHEYQTNFIEKSEMQKFTKKSNLQRHTRNPSKTNIYYWNTKPLIPFYKQTYGTHI